MTLTGKDAAATALTVLAVVTYVASRDGWNVWLVGGSHRWAAGAILVLGMFTCSLGSMTPGFGTKMLGVLGVFAVALAVAAIATASLTVLSLLVVDIVALWAASTVRHAWHPSKLPMAA